MNNKRKKILQIISKNSSAIDFSLPFFWLLRNEKKNIEIEILLLTPFEDDIFRNSIFYKNQLKKNKIRVYSLNFFSKFPLMKFYSKLNKKLPELSSFNFLFFLTNFHLYFFSVLKKALLYFYYRSINTSHILETINPDFIFLDHRDKPNKFLYQEIFNFIDDKNLLTFLTPHAHHYRYQVASFLNYNNLDYLPCNVKYLLPFKFSKDWLFNDKLRKTDFIFSGYPGLNQKFLQSHFSKVEKKNYNLINLAIIIRRFLQPKNLRPKNTDIFILDYKDMYSFFKKLFHFASKLKYDEVVLYIKPHPSNNIFELNKLLKNFTLSSKITLKISVEPIYELLPKIDACISLPSTTCLTTAYADIPTFLYETKLQKKIDSNWNKLFSLYRDVTYRFSSFDDLLIKMNHLNLYKRPKNKIKVYYYKNNDYKNVIKWLNI